MAYEPNEAARPVILVDQANGEVLKNAMRRTAPMVLSVMRGERLQKKKKEDKKRKHEKITKAYQFPIVGKRLAEAAENVKGIEHLLTEDEKNEAKIQKNKKNVASTSEGAVILFGSSGKPIRRANSCRAAASQKHLKQKRTGDIEIVYKDRKYKMPALYHNKWNERNEDRTLLNDTIIEFYMCQWMFCEVFNSEIRRRFHVFHTFFYTKLYTRFSHLFKDNFPRRSELGDHYNRLFQNVKPAAILQKEILVIPVHLDKPKHWFLILVHNPSGAIQHFPVPKKSFSKRIAEDVQSDEGSECRILIMDSLCHSQKYRETLKEAHDLAFEYLSIWLQMAAAAMGEELMYNRIRKVVCETLPKQTNSVDCGIYMMAFAEYFTWFNTEWMKIPTESLVYLKMEDELKAELNSEEPRIRLEALLQRLKLPKQQ